MDREFHFGAGTNPIEPNQPSHLFPFVDYHREWMPERLSFQLCFYLELLDWTGRQFNRGKGCAVDDSSPPVLKRLNIKLDKWLYATRHFESSLKGYLVPLKPWWPHARNWATNEHPDSQPGNCPPKSNHFDAVRTLTAGSGRCHVWFSAIRNESGLI